MQPALPRFVCWPSLRPVLVSCGIDRAVPHSLSTAATCTEPHHTPSAAAWGRDIVYSAAVGSEEPRQCVPIVQPNEPCITCGLPRSLPLPISAAFHHPASSEAAVGVSGWCTTAAIEDLTRAAAQVHRRRGLPFNACQATCPTQVLVGIRAVAEKAAYGLSFTLSPTLYSFPSLATWLHTRRTPKPTRTQHSLPQAHEAQSPAPAGSPNTQQRSTYQPHAPMNLTQEAAIPAIRPARTTDRPTRAQPSCTPTHPQIEASNPRARVGSLRPVGSSNRPRPTGGAGPPFPRSPLVPIRPAPLVLIPSAPTISKHST